MKDFHLHQPQNLPQSTLIKQNHDWTVVLPTQHFPSYPQRAETKASSLGTSDPVSIKSG